MPYATDQVRQRLGASTNLFFWDPVRLGRDQIVRLRQAGIGSIEIAAALGQFDHNDAEQTAELKAACDETGMRIVSFHCPDLPWACPYPKVRDGTIAEMLAMCRAADALGGPMMVCHFQPDEAHESFLRHFLPLLEGTDVRLTIENGENLRDYAAFVDRIGSPRFGMIVDIGHTRDPDGRNPFTCPDRARETIKICGRRLFHLHLHEFWDDADHWPPFYKGGLIRWGELFEGLHDIDYQGAFMFESVPAIPNDAEAFDDHLRRIVTFPDQLARQRP